MFFLKFLKLNVRFIIDASYVVQISCLACAAILDMFYDASQRPQKLIIYWTTAEEPVSQ